jgi:hypothetical protein
VGIVSDQSLHTLQLNFELPESSFPKNQSINKKKYIIRSNF